MGVKKVWLKWNQVNALWSKINLKWSEIYILIEIASGGGGGDGRLVVNKDEVWQSVDKDLKKRGFSEEDREKFLKIVVKVNGLEVDTSRKLETVKKSITVEHIKNTISQVAPDVRIQAMQVKRT